MRRYEAFRKPVRCPHCQAEQIGTLLYGMPVFSPDLEARVKSGEIILAGCSMTGDDPAWQCKICGTGIYRKSRKTEPATHRNDLPECGERYNLNPG